MPEKATAKTQTQEPTIAVGIRKPRKPLAERLTSALQGGFQYAKRERELKSTFVPAGREYSGADVTAIRARRNMTQAQFALLLAVSIKTLQSWEQGVRKPSKPTMRLLQIFDSPEDFRPVLMVREQRKDLPR